MNNDRGRGRGRGYPQQPPPPLSTPSGFGTRTTSTSWSNGGRGFATPATLSVAPSPISPDGGWRSVGPGRSDVTQYYPRGRGSFPAPGGSNRRPSGASTATTSATTGSSGQVPGIYALNQPAPIDSRLTLADQDALVANFKRLHLRGDFPHRPGWGAEGMPIKLRSNFFPIKYPTTKLFDYVVKVDPQINIKRVRKRLYDLLEQTPEFLPFKDHVVHDSGGRLISAKRLPIPDSGVIIKVAYSDEEEEGDIPAATTRTPKVYTVTVVLSGQLDTANLDSYLEGEPSFRGFDPLPIISALNIIIAHHPSHSGINVGRNRFFFRTDNHSFALGGGLEAWKGYYSSVRPTFKQLMLNVNVCTTTFYQPQRLSIAMIEYAKTNQRCHGFVKGLRVETKYLKYTCRKTIKRLSEKNAKQEAFVTAKWGHVTVEEYFFKEHGIVLEHPYLQLVDVGSKERSNLLPPEVCLISPNQPFRGKLPDTITSAMIEHACKPPNINADSIVSHGLKSLGLDTSQPLKEFGISVDKHMSIVPGRILAPPSIRYGQGTVRIDERAGWNIRNVQFVSPMFLREWTVLVIQDNGRHDFNGIHDRTLNDTLSCFREVCRNIGMTVLKDPRILSVSLPQRDLRTDPTRSKAIDLIETKLRPTVETPKPQFILVMLSNGDKSIYAGLKRLCDVQLDLHTVCCLSQKIRQPKGRMQYCANIALKVNIKLGGVNHIVDQDSMAWLKQQPTMMIGSDVTHPGPGSAKGSPSIAAVVASLDHQFVHYPASLRLQEGRKEMITDLADMVHERLSAYRRRNNILPSRILFFRDGVSEGQFLTVTQDELPKIRQACMRFDYLRGPYRPKITLCIAGKRHHTRFYPTEPNTATTNGNPKPGTVVDRGVTAIYDFDFFLQAHGGLQGTVRPTHYFVVHDENGFNADTIQKLTNSTSYTYARATRAVSLVPPAYYADLACERGRCYIYELMNAPDTASVGAGTGAGAAAAGVGTTAASPTTLSAAQDAEVMREARAQWGRGPTGPGVFDTMFYL